MSVEHHPLQREEESAQKKRKRRARVPDAETGWSDNDVCWGDSHGATQRQWVITGAYLQVSTP